MRIVLCATALVLLGAATLAPAQPAGPPLTAEEIVRLLKAQDDGELVLQLDRRGVAFAVDQAVIDRLKAARAPIDVVRAVRRAGARRSADATTYEGVLALLRKGTPENEILESLGRSPTTFVLDPDQVLELTRAGASPQLLKAMRQRRVEIHSDVRDYALILDCSGSMDEKTTDGRRQVRKMDAAREVVKNLIRALPGKRLTLLVYGHTLDECEDAVEVVCSRMDLTPDFMQAVLGRIDKLEPRGYTPIALALRKAGAELADATGLCELVLITDGMETCKGDPCAEARKLVNSLHLRGGLQIIAFCTSREEQKEVDQIARAGQSELKVADDAAGLRRRLEELAKERAREEARRRQEEAERAAANRARLAAALKRIEVDAAEAAASAAKARESAENAGHAAKAAQGAAQKARVGLANANRARAAAKRADDAARRAGKAFELARGAARAAAALDRAEDAEAVEKEAAGDAARAVAAAAEAEAAGVEAEAARAAVAQAIKDGAANRDRARRDDAAKAADAAAQAASKAAQQAREAALQAADISKEVHEMVKKGRASRAHAKAIGADAQKADDAAEKARAEADLAKKAAAAAAESKTADEASRLAGDASEHTVKAEDAFNQAQAAARDAAEALNHIMRRR
jgi:hypothetical protein